MKYTVYSQTGRVKIWEGPFIQATPTWKTALTEWLYKKFPDPQMIKIESISQREDERAFFIDLTIAGSLKVYLSMFAQIANPTKDDMRPYVIYTVIPLPLKEYFSIIWRRAVSFNPVSTIVSENEKKVTAENDLLVKLFNDIGYPDKLRQQTLAMFYCTQTYPSLIKNKLPEFYRVIYSPEFESMILQLNCTLHVRRKKKGVKFYDNSTAFFHIYEFMIPRYNAVLSNLEALNAFYKS